MIRFDSTAPQNTQYGHNACGKPLSIAEALEKLHSYQQGFYTCIDDDGVLDEIQNYADLVKGRFNHVVICGIGGSSLGAVAIRDAMQSYFSRSYPRLHVLENVDPEFIRDFRSILDLEQTLFIVVSKSGMTVETLSQYFFFRDLINEKGLDPRGHFVFVSEENKRFLHQTAMTEGIPFFAVPQNVGGRFSVQTVVGLLPAALMDLDIQAFWDGFRAMRDKLLSPDMETNLPYQLAMIQHGAWMTDRKRQILMPYATRLASFSRWWVQLVAESTGKLDDQGLPVGVAPVRLMGATDQHSYLQLLTQGPDDNLTMFIQVNQTGTDQKIPVERITQDKKFQYLHGVSFGELNHQELQGTADALTEAGRPALVIQVDRINMYSLGQLFMLFEGATAMLGIMMGVNPFDQPGVERSKELTRQYLQAASEG